MKYIFHFIVLLLSLIKSTNLTLAQWVEIKVSNNIVVECIAVSGGKIFAGGWCYLFTSTDNGITWISSPWEDENYHAFIVLQDGSRILYGGNWSTELSTDNGASWRTTSYDPANAFAVQPLITGGTIIFAGCDAKVICSTNNGESWLNVSSGLPMYPFVNALAVMSSSTVFASTNNGVYKSTNNGGNWTSSGLLATGVSSLMVKEPYIFASNNSLGIYRSSNNGSTWTMVNSGLSDINITCLYIYGAQIYAGTQSGKIFMADVSTLPVELNNLNASGSNDYIVLKWQTATEKNNYGFDVERRNITDCPISTPNSWKKIGFISGHGTSNAPNEYSYSDLKLSSGRYSYRLKQIDNDGTYKYSLEVEVDIPLPKSYCLFQNFPNPFNPSTMITFDIASQSFVTLIIYNTLGKEVSVVLSEELPPGRYSRQWNSGNLASGVYYCYLKASSFTDIKKLILLR